MSDPLAITLCEEHVSSIFSPRVPAGSLIKLVCSSSLRFTRITLLLFPTIYYTHDKSRMRPPQQIYVICLIRRRVHPDNILITERGIFLLLAHSVRSYTRWHESRDQFQYILVNVYREWGSRHSAIQYLQKIFITHAATTCVWFTIYRMRRGWEPRNRRARIATPYSR